MSELVWILVSAMVVNNFTLALFLGLCPFMGVSGRVETALRMGAANIFVMVVTSLCAWILNTYVLPTAPYLRIWAFPEIFLPPTTMSLIGLNWASIPRMARPSTMPWQRYL